MSAPATFYTVTDAESWPGTVALLNSLRLVAGHREPLVVLDNGLSAGETDAALPTSPPSWRFQRDRVHDPPTLKPFRHLADADRHGGDSSSAADMIAAAPRWRRPFRWREKARSASTVLRTGRAIPVDGLRKRHELFALRAPLRRQPYLEQRLRRLSTEQWPHLLEDWWVACSRIPPGGVCTESRARLAPRRLGCAERNLHVEGRPRVGRCRRQTDLQAPPGDEVVVVDEDRLV